MRLQASALSFDSGAALRLLQLVLTRTSALPRVIVAKIPNVAKPDSHVPGTDALAPRLALVQPEGQPAGPRAHLELEPRRLTKARECLEQISAQWGRGHRSLTGFLEKSP